MSALAATFPTSRVSVVNVAFVPQGSFLRYPGGKTWLLLHIREWLRHSGPEIPIEPFAVKRRETPRDFRTHRTICSFPARIDETWRKHGPRHEFR